MTPLQDLEIKKFPRRKSALWKAGLLCSFQFYFFSNILSGLRLGQLQQILKTPVERVCHGGHRSHSFLHILLLSPTLLDLQQQTLPPLVHLLDLWIVQKLTPPRQQPPPLLLLLAKVRSTGQLLQLRRHPAGLLGLELHLAGINSSPHILQYRRNVLACLVRQEALVGRLYKPGQGHSLIRSHRKIPPLRKITQSPQWSLQMRKGLSTERALVEEVEHGQLSGSGISKTPD